jgi:FkbM family methyltransferase
VAGCVRARAGPRRLASRHVASLQETSRRLAVKARRAGQHVRAYSNWPEALAMKALPGHGLDGTRVVRCRNGIRVAVRPKTSDMYIASEALAYGGYRALAPIVLMGSGPRAVIDLGAHIGVVSLLAARTAHQVRAIAYEPGPQNASLLRRNLELNPLLAPRIEVHEAAAGARAGTAHWRFDARDPSGSRLVDDEGGHPVRVVGLRDVLGACALPVAALKIDVEGSEYDLLDGSEATDWRDVPAVLVELHADPAGRSSPGEWISRMRSYGYAERDRILDTVVLVRP